MAGSDWRKLLYRHRASSQDEQANVYLSGSRRTKGFREANYDKLMEDLQLRKEAAHSSAEKVDRLVGKAKESKEENLILQHKKAWKRMTPILKSQVDSCQEQIEAWRSEVILKPLLQLNEFASEVYLLNSEQYTDRESFKDTVTFTIRSLRRRVLEFARQKRTSKEDGGMSLMGLQEDITLQISDAKQMLEEVKGSLLETGNEAEKLVQHVYNQYICAKDDTDEKQFTGGVPEEVWSLECPNDGLRQKMADEFNVLDDHFTNQLVSLNGHFQFATKNLLIDNWSEEDRLRYDLVLQQYPPNEGGRRGDGVKNRRALYIDRLMKEMPAKSRKEIVDYESWSCAHQYYRTQKAVLLSSWGRAHWDLLVKVKQAYNTAQHKWRLKEAIVQESNQQKILCESLAHKVREWREQCLKLQRQQAEESAARAVEEEAWRRKEEKRLKRKKELVRNQIEEYHLKKRREEEDSAEKHRHLVEEVKKMTEEELRKGRDRVQFRDQLLVSKHEEMLAKADRIREREMEKERQLEALRELVRIEAPSDPLRVMKDTEASKAKLLIRFDEDQGETLDLQKPLFPVFTFTDQKIMSDRRFRVSNALREAGLISTDYAQKILSSIPPPKPPRRDQKSSLFKHNLP